MADAALILFLTLQQPATSDQKSIDMRQKPGYPLAEKSAYG